MWCWCIPSVPAKTIPELIALAKKEPGKLNFASAGVGSGIHLGAELFACMAGVKLTHVPYKGTGPALTDLIGGHVAIYFSSLPPAVGLIKDGARSARWRSPAPSARRCSPTCRPWRKPACRATRRCCTTGSSRRPARRGRSIDKLNAALRTALAAPRSKAAHGDRRRRGDGRRRPRNTPPTSTRKNANGRTIIRQLGRQGGRSRTRHA